MPVLRAAFVAASIAWTLLLPVAPYVVTRAHASAFGAAVVLGLYSVGALICHQRPERSFHLWAAQLPVCARCTGIYVGAAVACVVLAARGRYANGRHSPDRLERAGSRRLQARVTGWSERIALAAAVLPTGLTLVYEWTTGHVPSNATRAAAGAPVGVVVAWLVVQATGSGAAVENQVN